MSQSLPCFTSTIVKRAGSGVSAPSLLRMKSLKPTASMVVGLIKGWLRSRGSNWLSTICDPVRSNTRDAHYDCGQPPKPAHAFRSGVVCAAVNCAVFLQSVAHILTAQPANTGASA